MGIMPDLTDEAKAEIAEAVRIVREDKREARLRAIHEHLIPPTPESNPPKDGEPTPPPTSKKDGEDDPPKPKKSGLWWGDSLEDEE
jgi:hypothetical protein